ncbi:aldo/keto reductase [Cyanobium sp. NIES-981]|uniref:aldo/keto reductase n=1 Tax=Cyanobium sp. NIES-981 TaxID=1851505 RepID=UPI0007DD4D44|nr:aldo/keto reductase [Cyanobium sp. NIES-981]SBO43877.1 2,5-diketo-D-gluconic acid reductase A [Cyanobium sp. NIES-981]
MAGTPRIPLLDGTALPQIGFGTFNIHPDHQPTRANNAATARAVATALDVGYRHIDTAQMYGNEQGVGEAIGVSGLPRQELYVASKLGNDNHRPEDVRRSFGDTLARLGLEQLDLFLMHWPLPSRYGGDYVSTWDAMGSLVDDGRLRTAGVSNFQPAHLERIIGATGRVPAVNQIEVHPYFANRTARQASQRHGVVVVAWSPLGQGSLLLDPLLGRIAAVHGRTVAQIVLRWHCQHGHGVIPKSAHRQRMQDNLDLFGFELSDEEMAAIDGLDRGEAGRIGPHPDTWA